MSSSRTAQEAESILKPLFTDYLKSIDNQKWDVVEAYYHPNAFLVQKDKEGAHWFGNREIANLIRSSGAATGKTVNFFSAAEYRGSEHYLVLTADYKTETEHAGVITGTFLQIWKQHENTFLIYHDEFTVNA